MFKQKQFLTILGILIITAGIGVGVILVQQTQQIKEKAATACTPGVCGCGSDPTSICTSTGTCGLSIINCTYNCPYGLDCRQYNDPNAPKDALTIYCKDSSNFANNCCSSGFKVASNNRCILPCTTDSCCHGMNNIGSCDDQGSFCAWYACNNSCHMKGTPTCVVCNNLNQCLDVNNQCCTGCCQTGWKCEGSQNFSYGLCNNGVYGTQLYTDNKCTIKCGDGGGIKPTPKPTSKPKPSSKPSPTVPGNCSSKKANPSSIGPFTQTGKVTITAQVYTLSSVDVKIALKKNATTCSSTDNDIFLEKNVTNTPTIIDTNLTVSSGDSLCVFTQYNDSKGTQTNNGWVPPNGNSCGAEGSTIIDISPLITEAEKYGTVAVSQCWSGAGEGDCDFNDLAYVFTSGRGGTSGPGIKLRFQGITKKANDQKITASLKTGGSEIWSVSDINITNDVTGVYTLVFDQEVSTGTYDFRVKGHSHLQKTFTNLVYNGTGADLSISESHQARAGDVTDDNTITIEDVAQVSKYYTDFAVPVNSSDEPMMASDINKDGKITIQDIALIAINWSDFEVKGDQ